MVHGRIEEHEWLKALKKLRSAYSHNPVKQFCRYIVSKSVKDPQSLVSKGGSKPASSILA